MAELFSEKHIVRQTRSSMFYFRHWKKWVLLAALRLGFLACLPVLILGGVIGDIGATIVSCLYPEVYFLLVLSWFTGSEPGRISGEMLGVAVFLDTLVGGYLLNVTLNVRKLRRTAKSHGLKSEAE